MATLSFKNIDKVYDNNVQAVFDFCLEVADKEFIVFVGPSGCGKSTTLRMVAGLEDITAGELYIDDRLVNDVDPKDRDIAMVFQNYALYPHMTVYDNMAFALKMRKIVAPKLDKEGNPVLDENGNQVTYLRHYTKQEIADKINEAAEILDLTPYLKRKPAALSGGQRQRVALGRAIVRKPKVFLMDEPLSNLDAKLRVQTRTEISKIHERVGATTIYVTHDQTEAMTMADRIVVMKDGYIQQIGSPKDIYNNPANMFVGSFIGSPAMNFVNGVVKGDKFEAVNGDKVISLKLPERYKEALKAYDGKEVVMGVRPEEIKLAGDVNLETPSDVFELTCDVSELLGYELIIYSQVNGQKVLMKVSASNEVNEGDVVKAQLDLAKIHFFDKVTTARIVPGMVPTDPVVEEEVKVEEPKKKGLKNLFKKSK